MHSSVSYVLLCLLLVGGLVGCSEDEDIYMPKPKGFHRITLPAHEYLPLSERVDKPFPYSFAVSKYAKVVNDPHFLAQDYWIEVEYPDMGAEIDISYKPIMNRPDSLQGYLATSHKLTRKHSVKATKIDEFATVGGKNKQLPAVVFELSGEVPSYFHWYAHDSTEHFVRAALYFNEANAADSLKPIIEYLKVDMMEMLNTLELGER